MSQIERDSRWSLVAAYCHQWALDHHSVYMCAPFWRYARQLGLLG